MLDSHKLVGSGLVQPKQWLKWEYFTVGTLSRHRSSAFHQHPHGVGHSEGVPPPDSCNPCSGCAYGVEMQYWRSVFWAWNEILVKIRNKLEGSHIRSRCAKERDVIIKTRANYCCGYHLRSHKSERWLNAEVRSFACFSYTFAKIIIIKIINSWPYVHKRQLEHL